MKGEKSTISTKKKPSIAEVLATLSRNDLSIKLGPKETELVKKAVAAEKKAASTDFVVRCSAKRI